MTYHQLRTRGSLPQLPPYNNSWIHENEEITNEIALDCEMIECYQQGPVLARVSVVNLFGHLILDSYVEPPGAVRNYRTRWSGIRPWDLEDAPSFEDVQYEIECILDDRILVGHSLDNDLRALKLDHPEHMIRDVSKYYKDTYDLRHKPSLRYLTRRFTGLRIQEGEHDSIIDAQAAMCLYVSERIDWQYQLNRMNQLREVASSNPLRMFRWDGDPETQFDIIEHGYCLNQP